VYEEHDARVQAGYKLDEWYALDPLDRALEVEHYRLRHLVASHRQAAEAQAIKRKRK
jgi:hypothetical protein